MAKRAIKIAKPPISRSARLSARLADVLRRLEASYGPVERAGRPSRVLDVLVEATLAQNTSMPNAIRGYRALRRRFRSWRAVAEADVGEIQRQIQVCGLAQMRAARLRAMLIRIRAERRRYSLEWLRRVPAEEASAYLTSFHGVGPKTTSYVALFGLGLPTLPVDHGVMRVTRRLGLVRATAREAEITTKLSPAIARGDHLATHVLMFQHAKRRCLPRNPKCIDCRLLAICPYGQRRVRHLPPRAFVEIGLSSKARQRLLAGFISAGMDHRSQAIEGTR